MLAAGLLTTVQDLGRFHYAHFGVSASGAADPLALRGGNLLVGNAENAAAIEMTLVGANLEFDCAAVVALTGSDFGSGAPLWRPFEVRAGEVLRCGPTRTGARCYLCVRGGIAAPHVMGSASVHVMTGVGGRPLRKGDSLPIGDEAVRRPRPPAVSPPDVALRHTVRATPSSQAEWFGDELYTGPYVISEESNRMGLRLRGQALPSVTGHMISEGTPLGAVQAPPDGQPIILFVEHQTTGGYPKPANVVSADFWRLGQLRPRDEIRFEKVNMQLAYDLLREQEQWLYALVRS